MFFVVIFVVVGLVGCEGAGSELSARDFNTRLSNMATSLNERELAEISTMIINAHRNDFDDIEGWHTAHNVLNNEVLRKQIRLDRRPVTVTLDLSNNRVSNVWYHWDNANHEDFFKNVDWDIVGENQRITTLNESREQVVIEDRDEIITMFAESIVYGSRIDLTYRWDFTNRNETDATIVHSFSIEHSSIAGVFYFSSIRISLR